MIEAYVNLARAHAPLLIVSLPFLGAAVAFAVNAPRASWVAAVLAASLAAVLGADFCGRFLLGAERGPLAQEGLAIGADALGAFSAALVAAAAACVVTSAAAFFQTIGRNSAPFALALMLCVSGGWSGAALARDFTTFFVFVEIAWLSQVGLVALLAGAARGALNGAQRMLFLGGVASALLLIGVGLIERGLGGGDIASMASVRIALPNTTSLGAALIIMALALKAGLAPLNAWAAAAYGRAGGMGAVALGGLGVAGAVLALAHIAAAASPSPAIGAGVGAALSALGMLSAAIGSVQAIGATTIWRLGAYAVSAQAGCALIGIGLGSTAGLEASVIQIVALSASSVALFGASVLGRADGAMASLDGLGRRAPVSGAVMTVGALSLMGAPLTLSFLGRWRLIEAALGVGWWWAAGAVIAVSLAGSYYGGRIIERVYFRHATQVQMPTNTDGAWRLALAPAIAAAVFAILCAIEPTLLMRAASAASQTILDAAP